MTELSKHDALYNAFVHPKTHSKLSVLVDGLLGADKNVFPFLKNNVIDFISSFSSSDDEIRSLEMYNTPVSTEIYRNFLDWLFSTFNESEVEFRKRLLKPLNLSLGDKVLITSVGLGDDIPLIQKAIGPLGELHAQDISKEMILLSSEKSFADNLMFSISNLISLPYADNYFDSVFHFGGINLVGDIEKAITEMVRVCKIGGRVVFGDESIAPHLRNTEYGNIALNNNRLWGASTPLHLLPHEANEIQLNYILGNCFYVISFTKNEGFPFMNIDVEHKGLRGGSMRTRFYGQIEGLKETTKKKLYDKSKESHTSVHILLEKIINDAFD